MAHLPPSEPLLDRCVAWLVWLVWCGVVWCGVLWCGVVWCGVVWCGVLWCGVKLRVGVNKKAELFYFIILTVQ